jgi:hypothetical protein
MRVALNRDHAAALSVIAGAWGTVTAAAGPLSVRWDQLALAVGLARRPHRCQRAAAPRWVWALTLTFRRHVRGVRLPWCTVRTVPGPSSPNLPARFPS